MSDLKNVRVAVVASDGFEEAELTEPVKALKEAGAQVEIVGPKPGEIQGVKHDTKTIKVNIDRTLAEVQARQYDAVVLPGGAMNADNLRMQPGVQTLLKET
jgi:protease I